MSNKNHGSPYRTPEGPETLTTKGLGQAPGQPTLFAVSDRAGVLGWTREWHSCLADGFELVEVPLLYLSQAPTIDFLGGRSFSQVFQGASLRFPGEEPLKAFDVVRADFPFHRTGRPELTNVLLSLENGVPFTFQRQIKALKVQESQKG